MALIKSLSRHEGTGAADGEKSPLCALCRANTDDPNAGIGYYNTTAMSLIFDDMIEYARSKMFRFSALDNTLMV